MKQGGMQKYVYIVIHDKVSRVISFVRNIIDLYSQTNKYQFSNKIQS